MRGARSVYTLCACVHNFPFSVCVPTTALLTLALTTLVGGVGVPRRRALDYIVLVPLSASAEDRVLELGHSIVPAVHLAMEHINNNTQVSSEFYLRRVFVRDTGCSEPTKTAVNIVSVLRDLLIGREGPVTVIGPACSEDSIFVINMIQRALDIPVFYSGTSPVLSMDNDERPGAFGMVSSSTVLVDTLIRIASKERWSWDNVAVLYDNSREHFQDTYDAFVRQLNTTQRIGYARLISRAQIPLREIIDKNHIRIVIVFSDVIPSRQIVCLAGQTDFNFIFPIHQLIFTERVPNDLLAGPDFTFTEESNRKTYHCDRETMIRGLNGSIFLNQALGSVDPRVVTVSNYTAGDIKMQYRSRLAEYSHTIDLNLSESLYAYVYYDATWAMALSLKQAFDIHIASVSDLYTVIQNRVKFQGVSGWIEFSNRRHVTNPVDILQANATAVVTRGQLNDDVLNYAPGTFISNEFKTEDITLHSILAAGGVIATAILLLVTVTLQISTVVYRHYPSIKASSAQLNHFIFIGCYLFLSSTLASMLHYTFPATSDGTVLCNFELLSSLLGSCIIFGTILVKSWRTYRIFHHVFKTARGHRYGLHDATLAMMILSIVSLELLLFIPVFIFSPLRGTVLSSFDRSQWPPVRKDQYVCETHSVGYLAIPVLFYVCLIIAAVFLATLNRNVKRKHFQTSRYIFILVYLLTISWGIGTSFIVLSFYLKFSVNVTYAISLCVQVITTTLCLVMLIGPSFVPIFTSKDVGRFSVYFNSFRRNITSRSNSSHQPSSN